MKKKSIRARRTMGKGTDSPTAAHLRVLRKFAREVLSGYRNGEVGDIDGGWLQDRAIELGLLVPVTSPEGEALYGWAPMLKRQRPSYRKPTDA